MPYLDIAIVFLLILLNGFFALSELAIVSSRRARLHQLERRGSRGAARALALAEDPTGFLSTVQVGITLIGIVAGAYSGTVLGAPLADALRKFPSLADVADSVAIAIVVVATTYASLIIGELVPKRLALQNAEALAARVAMPMTLLARVGRPVVWFLRVSTNGVLRLLGAAGPPESTVTEEEVKALIAEGTETGVFHRAERQMLERVLRFADQPVRAIMLPRPAVVFLAASAPIDEAIETIRREGHSRYPLCGEGMDDVLGVVHVKDVLALARDGGTDLSTILQTPLFVSPNLPALELLERLRENRVHMAVVVDEYGDVDGIVTPVDVLEAIAGRLPESPEETPAAVKREDGSWLMDGDMNLGEAAATLGLEELSAGGYTTLAGLALFKLGEIPDPGARFEAEGWTFEVIDLDGRRIDKILAYRQPDGPAEP
jgi:putative hemolysin